MSLIGHNLSLGQARQIKYPILSFEPSSLLSVGACHPKPMLVSLALPFSIRCVNTYLDVSDAMIGSHGRKYAPTQLGVLI
jgi:hypothetical protein